MRRSPLPFGVLLLIAVTTAYLACGDDDDGGGASAAAYCETICEKQVECGLPTTQEQCVSTCTSGTDSSCTPSQSEANACLAAVDDLSCSDMMGGNFPEECNFCPEGGDTGGSDMGSDTGAGGGDTGGQSQACEDLAQCCPQIQSGTDQRNACDAAVTADVSASCSGLQQAFEVQGLCN